MRKRRRVLLGFLSFVLFMGLFGCLAKEKETEGMVKKDIREYAGIPLEDYEKYQEIQAEVRKNFPLQIRTNSRATTINPTREQIIEHMKVTGEKYNIPYEIMYGIGEKETNLMQFWSSGQPVISGDNGIGIMQVTPWAVSQEFDENALKWDYKYNIEAGAEVILSKWNYAKWRNPIGDMNPKVLENWYITLWAYNGYSTINNPNEYNNGARTWSNGSVTWTTTAPYQDKILNIIKEQLGVAITPLNKTLLPANGIPYQGKTFLTPTPYHYTKNSVDYGSEIVSLNIPKSIKPGEKAKVSITLKNTGNIAWKSTDYTRLGSLANSSFIWGNFANGGFSRDAKDQRAYINSANIVGKNGIYKFEFEITAPKTEGTYDFSAKMVRDGVNWFGEEINEKITVEYPLYSSEFISNTLPLKMKVGEEKTVSIKVKNSGQFIWTKASNVRLAAITENNFLWLGINETNGTGYSKSVQDQRLFLNNTESIAINSIKEFNFKIKAPENAGNYKFRVKMVRDGVAWFDEIFEQKIIVEPTLSYSYDGGNTNKTTFKIEAEKYDKGGEGVAYHDKTVDNIGGDFRKDSVDVANREGKCVIGWIETEEWLQYSDIKGTGEYYDAVISVSSIYDTRKLHIELNGKNVSGTVIFNKTGSWSTYTEIPIGSFKLAGDKNIIKIVSENGSFNVDYIKFNKSNSYKGGNNTNFSNFRIEAEDYDINENGYYDKSSGNTGGAYRKDSVDIAERTGQCVVGWIESGEWLNYSSIKSNGGKYKIKFSVSSIYNDRKMGLEINGTKVTYINFNSTGDWNKYTTVISDIVELKRGINTIKLVAETSAFNIDYFEFTDDLTISNSSLPKTAIESNIYHIVQYYHWLYNPTGPMGSWNCGPTSLAVCMSVRGKIPMSLERQKRIDYARALMSPNAARYAVITVEGKTIPLVDGSRMMSDFSQIRVALNTLGGKSVDIYNQNQLDNALNSGHPVVVAGYINDAWRNLMQNLGNNRYGSGNIGHLIAITGKTNSGKYIVNDSMFEGGGVEMTFSQFLTFASQGWSAVSCEF